MFDWFWNALSFFGLYSRSCKLLFLGLDNAGKTTLMHMLRDDRLALHQPTFHPTCEELQVGNVRLQAFDLGGHESARRVWPDYYVGLDAIVFLVDVADQPRIQESARELQGILGIQELEHVPVLVLGNKIDLPSARMSPDELQYALGLRYITAHDAPVDADQSRAVGLFMCSVKNRQGYGEALQWLIARI